MSDLYGWEVGALHRYFGSDVHFVGSHAENAREYKENCYIAKPDIVYVPAEVAVPLLARKGVPVFAEMIDFIPHYLHQPSESLRKIMAIIHTYGPQGIEFEPCTA